MSYIAAINQLNAMVPELLTLSGQPHRKFSLDEVRVLLAALGDPQKRFPSVLIAGTNGKGSTACTLASILTASGLEVGLYTSPHLERVNERIRIDSTEIADDAFAGLYFRVHDTAQKLVREGNLEQLPSFFEILTAQSLLYFAEAGVQIAVLEVGMGGRLDATNVVDPLLSVITDISLDHTEWLGSTIAAIAREKAGILRPGGTLIALPQHPEADLAVGEVAVELCVRCVNASVYMPNIPLTGAIAVGPNRPYRIEALGKLVEVNSSLAGSHQQRNVALAIAAAVELAGVHGFPVTPVAIAAGIRDTNWPGRLERFEIGGVEWILDVAHNSAGAWALQAGLGDVLGDQRSRTLIFSCLRDKPLAEMARILFPQFDRVIFAPIHSARAAAMDDLLAAACATGTHAVAADSVAHALGLAEEHAKQSVGGGVVVVSGSVYLVGEARGRLVSRKEVQR
jgi:dihydrofolate synthase/folylpolyglutamate synthase